MSSPILALKGQYLDLKDFRYARNQREAGIDHLEWEDRIRPLRPISYDVAMVTGMIVAFVGLCIVLI